MPPASAGRANGAPRADVPRIPWFYRWWVVSPRLEPATKVATCRWHAGPGPDDRDPAERQQYPIADPGQRKPPRLRGAPSSVTTGPPCRHRPSTEPPAQPGPRLQDPGAPHSPAPWRDVVPPLPVSLADRIEPTRRPPSPPHSGTHVERPSSSVRSSPAGPGATTSTTRCCARLSSASSRSSANRRTALQRHSATLRFGSRAATVAARRPTARPTTADDAVLADQTRTPLSAPVSSTRLSRSWTTP